MSLPPSFSQHRLLAAFFLGALAPLGALFFAPLSLGGFLILLAGLGVLGFLSAKIPAPAAPTVKEEVAATPCAAAPQACEIEALAARLLSLTEAHQEKAALSTSAAAKATESATIIASAIEQMNATIASIGQQADEALHMATCAVEKTKAADDSVVSLSGKSEEILSIVALIQQVAKHTNLLALNATIEAARAGEHGRGFAIVASEVKALARQTAQATTKIEEQINAVRMASKDVTSRIKDLEASIQTIERAAQTIKTALFEETQAVQGIAQGAQEATQATTAVTNGISHMLVTTEEIRTAIANLK